MANHADPAYVAEQTGQVLGVYVLDTPLEERFAAAKAETLTEAMGALVVFEGVVRDHDSGSRVQSLSYSAHPSAQEQMAAVLDEIIAEHPHVRLWAAHRIGDLSIGDTAFLVVAAAAHRKEAFAACSETADRVKAEVPIWKEQVLVDGTTQWVGIE